MLIADWARGGRRKRDVWAPCTAVHIFRVKYNRCTFGRFHDLDYRTLKRAARHRAMLCGSGLGCISKPRRTYSQTGVPRRGRRCCCAGSESGPAKSVCGGASCRGKRKTWYRLRKVLVVRNRSPSHDGRPRGPTYQMKRREVVTDALNKGKYGNGGDAQKAILSIAQKTAHYVVQGGGQRSALVKSGPNVCRCRAVDAMR